MMRLAPSSLLVSTLLACAMGQAHAQAYTQSNVELRLGPGTDWTIVTELPPSTFVRIVGCDPRYGWCQVNVPHGLQGWLPGDILRDVRDDQPLRQDAQGQPIEFPAIVFTGIQFGQPIVPGAATQRKNITQRKPLPTRPSVAASAPRDPVAPLSGGGEREPVFPPRGGPR